MVEIKKVRKYKEKTIGVFETERTKTFYLGKGG